MISTAPSPSLDLARAVSLDDIRKPIDAHLDEFRTFFKDALNTDVFLLNQIIAYLLKTKGKELRPILVFLSAAMAGDISRRTHIAATMIELLHTATLIHDDVVDDADRRRGFLSINKVWRNKAGVLLGDFLLSKGLLVALDNDEFQLLKVLSNAVKRMSEGELRQLKGSKLLNLTEERYFQIISGKTASLISACCECGAISAGASAEAALQAREIGELIGLAFQIRDDLFDYGVDDVGKPTANDIHERKMTLPLIAALQLASPSDKRRLTSVFKKSHKSTAEVNLVITMVHELGGMAYAHKKMLDLAHEASEKLRFFDENEGRTALRDLIQFVVTRKK